MRSGILVLVVVAASCATLIATLSRADTICGGEVCAGAAPTAQRQRDQRDESLLDKVGLGSLRDIPWDALPAALGLSALIGAAGGFVYEGIIGQGEPAKRPQDQAGDRPNP